MPPDDDSSPLQCRPKSISPGLKTLKSLVRPKSGALPTVIPGNSAQSSLQGATQDSTQGQVKLILCRFSQTAAGGVCHMGLPWGADGTWTSHGGRMSYGPPTGGGCHMGLPRGADVTWASHGGRMSHGPPTGGGCHIGLPASASDAIFSALICDDGFAESSAQHQGTLQCLNHGHLSHRTVAPLQNGYQVNAGGKQY